MNKNIRFFVHRSRMYQLRYLNKSNTWVCFQLDRDGCDTSYWMSPMSANSTWTERILKMQGVNPVEVALGFAGTMRAAIKESFWITNDKANAIKLYYTIEEATCNHLEDLL